MRSFNQFSKETDQDARQAQLQDEHFSVTKIAFLISEEGRWKQGKIL